MAARVFERADTLPQSASEKRMSKPRGQQIVLPVDESMAGRLTNLRGAGIGGRSIALSQMTGQMTSQISGGQVAWGQHSIQAGALFVEHVDGRLKRLVATWILGAQRLRLVVPATWRLFRWQTSHAFHESRWHVQAFFRRTRARRILRRLLPMLLLLVATVACSLVSKKGNDKETSLSVSPWAPDLSKPKIASPPRKRRDAPWAYVLPVDHGVRADRSGQGYFRAPRFHGEHNGLDLLAPVGTPVFSPCEGKAMAGVSQSFGRWIHVICPVPDEYMKAGEPHPWASFFYAHLDKTDLAYNEWVDVAKAQAVGQVGKSGNARGPNVQPHLHLELIVQKNRRTAMDERHLGKDQSAVPAADFFADRLSSECMAPFGFQAKSQMLRRARRLDPFIALTCLSDFKPNFIKAPSPLTDSSRAWTQYYVAKDFNVNLGVEDSKLAVR